MTSSEHHTAGIVQPLWSGDELRYVDEFGAPYTMHCTTTVVWRCVEIFFDSFGAPYIVHTMQPLLSGDVLRDVDAFEAPYAITKHTIDYKPTSIHNYVVWLQKGLGFVTVTEHHTPYVTQGVLSITCTHKKPTFTRKQKDTVYLISMAPYLCPA